MQVDPTLIMNEQYMYFQGSVWIHSNKQKKLRLTRKNMEKPAPKKTEQAWDGNN
jgi:hypothetical protein